MLSSQRAAALLYPIASFLLLAAWPQLAWAINASCSTSPNTYTETFTGKTYGVDSTWDSLASTNEGWGIQAAKYKNGGTISPSMRGGAFPTTSVTPFIESVGDRVLSPTSSLISDSPTLSNPIAWLADDYNGGCAVRFKRYNNPDDGFAVVVNDPYDYTTVSTNLKCSPGSAIRAVPSRDMDNYLSRSALVVLVPNNVNFEGTIKQAVLFRNDGDINSGADYTQIDITSLVGQQAGVAFHGGIPMAYADIDGDGRADLLVASSSGSVNRLLVFYADSPPATNWTFSSYDVLINDLGFTGPFADASNEAKGGPACATEVGGLISRGVTGLAAADINNDGLLDIVASSASEPNAHVFLGTSSTTFARSGDVVTPGAPGILAVELKDFNNDGLVDLLVVNDGRNCRGLPAFGQVMFATNPGNFASASIPLAAATRQIDWGIGHQTTLTNTASGLSSSPETKMFDVLLGKANTPGNFKWWFNQPNQKYYATTALAQSVVVQTPGPNQGNLGDVTMTSVSKSTPGGSSLLFEVSANGGVNWEPLTAAEVSGSKAHPFVYIGTALKWRVHFAAPTASLPSADAGYSPAATVDATVDSLTLRADWVSSRSFSRSSPTYGTLTSGGKSVDYIYSSTFNLPAFDGHLVRQSLANATSAATTAVQQITTANSWDAATQISSKGQGARTLFYSQLGSTTSNTNNTVAYQDTKFNFNQAQLNKDATLRTSLRLPSSRASTLFNQLRGGVSSSATLRDTGHGSPVFVGPPNQDSNFLTTEQNSYKAFVSANSSREAFVLQGANDGMLHAFDATTGSELWGYIPGNLLGTMSQELGYDDAGNLQFNHTPLVDGPISVSDVDSGGWKTVAIVGQADGTAADGRNFYFAVDVTNPTQPQPLWEMTQAVGTGGASCNPDASTQLVCGYSCSASGSSQIQNSAYDGEMLVTSTNQIGGKIYGLLEAEHFTDQVTGEASAGAGWLSFSSSTKTNLASASNGSYMQVSPKGTSCSVTSPYLHGAQACAQLSYRITAPSSVNGLYPMFRIYKGTLTGNLLGYSLDQGSWESGLTAVGTATNGWQWMKGNSSVNLAAGDHVLTVYMLGNNVALDTVALSQAGAAFSTSVKETPSTRTFNSCKSTGCKNTTLASPSSQEWPSCGVGKKQKCCDAGGGNGYCVALGSACSTSTASMGRAYSPAAIGRVLTSSGAGYRWVAFFGSGDRSNLQAFNQGMSLYMVDAYTGAPLGSWSVPSVAAPSADPNRVPALQAGPTLVDVDGDGNVDRVYFGDLAGRMWKLNTYSANPSSYQTCKMFDAGDPQQTGTRTWNPIFQQPTAAVLSANTAHVYFGTGVLPTAPSGKPSTFYSLIDTDALSACSSTARKVEWSVSEASGSNRNFSSATVVAGTVVYFSSYDANADSTNICANTTAASKIYGVAAKNFTSATGTRYKAGQSVLSGGVASFSTSGTVRSAAVVRGSVGSQVVRPPTTRLAATDLLMQQLTGETLRLTTPAAAPLGSRITPTRYHYIRQ